MCLISTTEHTCFLISLVFCCSFLIISIKRQHIDFNSQRFGISSPCLQTLETVICSWNFPFICMQCHPNSPLPLYIPCGGGQTIWKQLFTSNLIFYVWFKATCKISEPSDNSVWKKSKWWRKINAINSGHYIHPAMPNGCSRIMFGPFLVC